MIHLTDLCTFGRDQQPTLLLSRTFTNVIHFLMLVLSHAHAV